MLLLLGHYENFPNTIHGIARFTYRVQQKKIQQAIISAFHQLNLEKRKLEEITFSSPNCELSFELGVGEDDVFTFLDKNEVDILDSAVAKKRLTFLDFLCILKYHVVNSVMKRTPLKFDYYLLRFAFSKNYMELLICHERGPRHVQVEAIMDFLTNHIRNELAERYSITFKLQSVWTV
ncbi:MAG: hypothetical protein JSV51_05225 [Candidatus Bathyarchaeota archaeon]|nr:MAG: hypothetical protein JSV51_05225 [Candidatus Bathyarchaeota archaeon]